MQPRPHHGAGALLVLSLAILAGGAAIASAEGNAADSGFRPAPNGFNFPNWGAGENPQGDLTADDARCLFGDAACERVDGGHCVPTPAARMWIEEMNRGMGGGHCEGLAALSAAFYAGARQPQAYGAPNAYDLQVSDARVLRMISTLFTTQNLEPVESTSAQSRQMNTRQIVDTLIQSMQDKKETYTLGIYGADGGHAITPFAVEDVGGGRYKIHVYDNNYPGADNVVDVDTGADTWRYAAAALNPGEQAAPWEGTGGSMDLTPLSLRFQPLVCPFCEQQTASGICGVTPSSSGGPQAPAPAAPDVARPAPGGPAGPGPSSVVTTANCDQLSVTDKKSGKKAAFQRGRLVSQIPKAIMTRRRGTRGCAVQLPPGGDYAIDVAGRPGQAPQPMETAVFRPGQAINLDNASITADHTESIGLDDDSFSYRPSSDSKPTFSMATENPGGKDGYYEVDNLDLGGGHVFTIDERDDGRVAFDSDDPDLHHFDVDVKLEDEHGVEEHDFDNVDFDDQGQAILGPGDGGGLTFDMDSDSDGVVDNRDADDDNDGRPDAVDTDDDGDGTPDAQEQHIDDADGDGSPDAVDVDDDNDGTPDLNDGDDDGDGTPDAQEPEMDDADDHHDEAAPADEPDDQGGDDDDGV